MQRKWEMGSMGRDTTLHTFFFNYTQILSIANRGPGLGPYNSNNRTATEVHCCTATSHSCCRPIFQGSRGCASLWLVLRQARVQSANHSSEHEVSAMQFVANQEQHSFGSAAGMVSRRFCCLSCLLTTYLFICLLSYLSTY